MNKPDPLDQLDRLAELQGAIDDEPDQQKRSDIRAQLHYAIDYTDFAALAAHIRQREARLAEAEAKVAELSKPDMWWDWNNSEEMCEEPVDYLDRGYVSEGTVVRFQNAHALPDVYLYAGEEDGELVWLGSSKEEWLKQEEDRKAARAQRARHAAEQAGKEQG